MVSLNWCHACLQHHSKMCSGGMGMNSDFSLAFFKTSYISSPRKESSVLTVVFLPLSNPCGTVERAQKEVAEQEQELLRQKQKELQQVMEAQERSYKENMAQLHEKMETERKTLLREQEEMLAHKLKVRLCGPKNSLE